MKRLILCLGVAIAAWSQPAQVQTKTYSNATSSDVVLTFDSTTVSGRVIAVCVNHIDGGTTGFTITDNKSNSYSGTFMHERGAMYYAQNITGGATHEVTIAPNGTFGYISIVIAEYSGTAASAFDQTNNTSTVGSTYTTNNVTTTQASEVLVACIGSSIAQAVHTPDSPWVGTTASAVGINATMTQQYRVVSSTGTYAGTGSTTADASTHYNGILTFKGDAPPPGAARRRVIQ